MPELAYEEKIYSMHKINLLFIPGV
jgi:hypothetical protein